MDSLFQDIYRDKRVLVTGHTGFKGSWLSYWLSKIGARVTGYSLDLPSEPNHFNLINPDVMTVWGDILDTDRLTKTIKEHKPEIVFHLAAQALVRDSYLHPVKTLETNIIGTANVLEACRNSDSIKAIVNITSDKCYQNSGLTRGYRENDPMGGSDPYSASKGCAELVGNVYRSSFFNLEQYGKTHTILLADVRAGNVIGGGDWAKDRLIPDIIRAASQQQSVKIRNPHAIRPWQHVLEPLSGYLHLGWKLLEGKKEFADNWNFGPTNELSLTVSEVINHLKKHWDQVRFEVEKDTNNFHEASILLLDSTKARKQLKWQSVWSAEETFSHTIDWYKSYYQDSKAIITGQDLDQYIRDAKAKSIEWAS